MEKGKKEGQVIWKCVACEEDVSIEVIRLLSGETTLDYLHGCNSYLEAE